MEIVATHLAKEFQLSGETLEVLTDINVRIGHGRFVCLLGPSGCGKSTFLRCIAGLEFPTRGEVLVDGARIVGPGPDRSMVFQDYALFPWYNVAQNVQFGLRARRNKHLRDGESSLDRITQELLALVGLERFGEAYPHQISGGMRQRVALARALAVRPGALLMDEPFAAVDAITRAGLQRQLVEVWARTKKTVVFVTHSVEEATFLGDEVHVFSMRPATIRESVSIDLPRPRDMSSVECVAIIAQLHKAIDVSITSDGRPAS